MSETLQLKLYVYGRTLRSQVAIQTLKRICQKLALDTYELTVIDVLEYPEEAEHDKILATPTLIQCSPAPVRRIVGDLSDSEQVARGLELTTITWDLAV